MPTRTGKQGQTTKKTETAPDEMQAAYQVHTLAHILYGQLMTAQPWAAQPWVAPTPPTMPYDPLFTHAQGAWMQPPLAFDPTAMPHATGWTVPGPIAGWPHPLGWRR